MAYPSLPKTYQLKHEEVNHAAGEFVRLKRRGPQPALSVHSVHTGGIDCIRKKTKDKLPPGIHNRKKGKINKHQQTQQGLRAANDCQETEKASEDVRVKREVDRQREGSKIVVKPDYFKIP